MKTHLDQTNDICTSCDVPYRENLGLNGTCLALQQANESTTKLVDALKAIVKHQDITGGSLAGLSAVRAIAAKAIHDDNWRTCVMTMTMAAQLQSDIDRDIEERTNAIWSWVREHRNSLDSERGCRMMREAMNAAIESVCASIAPLITQVDELKEQLRSAKSALKKGDEGAEAMAKRLQGQVAKLSKQVEQSHSVDGFFLEADGGEVWVMKGDDVASEKWLRVKG